MPPDPHFSLVQHTICAACEVIAICGALAGIAVLCLARMA